MIKFFLGVAAFLSVAASTVCSAAERDESNALDVYLAPQTLAQLPDGRKFHFFCTGSGGPTILLDAGLALWSVSWRAIQPQMAQMTRVCAFDRAGLWFSDPGPMPRDSAAEVQDLHDALGAAGIKPPYVLIGHSYGGMTSRLFALRYTSQVAGMLLIDPSFADQGKKMGDSEKLAQENRDFMAHCASLARQSKLHAGMAETEDGAICVNPGRDDWSKKMSAKLIELTTKASFFETIISEDSEAETRSSRQLNAATHPFGAMPIVVLTQDEEHWTKTDEPDSDHKKRYAVWVAGHDEIAKSSTHGENIIVPGAGHFVHYDNPDLVLEKLRKMLESIRATSK